jgi:hypothetical protein
MHRRSIVRKALAVTAISASILWAGSQVFAAPASSLIAPGEPADLTLLFTGDVIGYLDPCG